MKDRPKSSFRMEDYLAGKLNYSGEGIIPGLHPMTIDDDKKEITDSCSFYKQEVNRHMVCKVNEDSQYMINNLNAQEQVKKSKDKNHTIKPVQTLVCEYHKKILENTQE